jgi:hypothetical protein
MVRAILAILAVGIGGIWLLRWNPFLIGVAMVVALIIAAAITDRYGRRPRGTVGDVRRADLNHPIGAYQDPDSAAASRYVGGTGGGE